MFSPMKLVTGAALALAAIALPGHAMAVPITTDLTSNGIVYHETGCTAAANGANTNTPSCSNIEWVATTAGFTLQATGGAGPLEGSNAAGNTSNADITFAFTATSTDGSFLSGVNVAINGSGTRTGITLVIPAGTYADGTSTSAFIGSDTTATVTAAKTFIPGASGPSNTVGFSADIKASSIASNTSTVNNVTLGVTKVPEPASTALLVTGLIAFGASRRRRR